MTAGEIETYAEKKKIPISSVMILDGENYKKVRLENIGTETKAILWGIDEKNEIWIVV